MDRELEIRNYYRILTVSWGPQYWWPAQSRFEVIVGAYLTQNTAWRNVERAIANLRRARVLTVAGIRAISVTELRQLVRPAGYFRQKAQRLKTFIAYLDRSYNGSLDRMFSQDTEKLRAELLELDGIGPETADSILLYAGNHPVFVVDAYTRRIIERHALLPSTVQYDEIRELFERSLRIELDCDQGETARGERRGLADSPSRMSRCERSSLVQRFNEMHALIVNLGKNYCFKSNPDCESCPLRQFLATERSIRRKTIMAEPEL